VAVRGLLKARGVALVAVITLALGIGTTTVVYSIVDGELQVWVALPAALLAAVLVACYLPARRAAATEPSSVLRQD
jgi:heme A synthase